MTARTVKAAYFCRHFLCYQSRCLTPAFFQRSNLRKLYVFSLQKPLNINFISTSAVLFKDKSRGKESKPKVKVHKSDDKELGQYVDVNKLRSDLNAEVEKLKQYYVQQLSIRSSLGVIETLKIDFEGKKYELQDLAQVAKKGKNVLAINLAGFPQAGVTVMKALRSSSLSLNPTQDGTLITVQLPSITKEHRENLAKQAKAAYVECKKVMDRIVDARNKEVKKENYSKDDLLRVGALLKLVEGEYLQIAENALKTKQDELKLEE